MSLFPTSPAAENERHATRGAPSMAADLRVSRHAPGPEQSPLRGGIPIYRTATVVSRTADAHALLRSPDAIETVERFYACWLEANGWRLVSHARRATVASLTARALGLGATISIYRQFSATGVAISVYAV